VLEYIPTGRYVFNGFIIQIYIKLSQLVGKFHGKIIACVFNWRIDLECNSTVEQVNCMDKAILSMENAYPGRQTRQGNLTSLIGLHNLNKMYQTPAGNIHALKDIDLEIGHGEFIAIVGKSGAGKSTLINMISCIDSPTSGEIIYQGKPIHSLGEDQKARWRGKFLGVVFQFFQLLPTLNIIENVTIPMDLYGKLPLHQRRERAMSLLEQVGIVEHAYKVPAKLSGGQQQRVAIARALSNDPPIIIADEPTGNLDSRTAAEILDLFAMLVNQGKTVLVVSHERSIASWATRTVELVDGEINPKHDTC
jgi:putative ABC transport system ATP-binding protein